VLLDVEQLDAKTILLKLIASLGTNEQSRLEIVRLQGLGKMAQFLQQGIKSFFSTTHSQI